MRLRGRLALGDHQSVVPELNRLVEFRPHHEGFARLLMTALYRSGRQAEALGVYQTLRQRLGNDLGIEPTAETQELEEKILLQDVGLSENKSINRTKSGLPTPPDRFVGRRRELSEIEGLLERHRCVTLTGVGGSGKTRLAVETAHKAVARYPDGVRWVELATLKDEDALAEHILLSFGDPGSHSDDPQGLLIEVLQEEHLLLLLDNCEHLIGPVAQLAAQLLSNCPLLQILATSRESLGIAGEATFHVPTMAVPPDQATIDEIADAESVRLLVDRVTAHDRTFAISATTADAAAQVCRRLDGIPLAIELAAARMRTMDIEEVATRLDHSLDLLTRGVRGGPQRQQTLRATIEWSYQLLSEPAQYVFRRCGSFTGTWDLAAIDAVAGSVEPTRDLVDELVEKSLAERSQPGRFRLLETVREFAFEQLVVSGEAHEVGSRHRDWYLDRARQFDGQLRGYGQVEAWTSLELDHDNLRGALRWCLDNDDPDGALELVAALGYFWMVRGFWREAWRWLQRALEAGGGAQSRARAITGEAVTEVIRVNYGAVVPLLAEAIGTLEDTDPHWYDMAVLLDRVGRQVSGSSALDDLETIYKTAKEAGDTWRAAFAQRYMGDQLERNAIGQLQESYDAFMELGDRWNAAFTMYFISGWHLAMENLEEGETAARRARDLASEIGDLIWYAHATRNLGLAALRRRDPEQARALMEEALEILAGVGDDACSATLYRGLAEIALKAGMLEECARLQAESIRSAMRLGSSINGSINLWKTAEIAVALGDGERAARFGAVAKRELDGVDDVIGPAISKDLAAIDALVDDVVDPEQRTAIAAGCADIELSEMLSTALEWCRHLTKGETVPAG